jgi:hypothetical protein
MYRPRFNILALFGAQEKSECERAHVGEKQTKWERGRARELEESLWMNGRKKRKRVCQLFVSFK